MATYRWVSVGLHSTRDVRNELLIVLCLDIHVGHDKNQYIPVYGDSIPTQRCINVHVRLSERHKICHLIIYTQSFTTVVKMVGRSIDKKDEIRVYIKARTKLGCSLKQLTTEHSTAYGPSCVVRQGKRNLSLV